MSDSTRESMRDLAPGYALGALTPEETRAFEAALSSSPELQRELAEYRELNALLAEPESRAPSAELKHRLRARITAEKTADRSSPPAAPPSRSRSFTPVAMGLGLAAAILLSVTLSLKVRTMSHLVRSRDSLLVDRERRLAQREATLNAILEPGVQLTTLTATGAAPPVVQVFWDRPRHSLIIHAFHLPQVPSGRAYQLWFLPAKGKPIPSQVFNTEPSGRGLVEAISVPAGEEISGFAVTVEPAGGSPQPTTTPILLGSVAGAR